MSQGKNTHGHRPRRSPVTYEEDKAWIAFYRKSGDPTIAAELVQHFDADPELKRDHAALYLHCKQTMRRNKERQARAKRIGYFVRMVMGALIVDPIQAMRRALRMTGDIAVECLPENRTEPAVRRVKHLTEKPAFANDQKVFSDQGVAKSTEAAAAASPSAASQGTQAA